MPLSPAKDGAAANKPTVRIADAIFELFIISFFLNLRITDELIVRKGSVQNI